ncbi:MAG: CaiB/BaiF CoA transferase family protein [Dehalococcoidia bacterium]
MSHRGLLKGVRVVDFSWLMAGPSGTLLLALAGADVIRIESTRSPDNYRKSFSKDGNPDCSPLFATVNMAKRSVLIDLKHPAGLSVAEGLVEKADLVVENFTPGTLDKLGLGYTRISERNPRIVMVSASAAGQSGPKSHFAGYAPHFASLAGLAFLTGHPDGPPTRFSRSLDARVGTYIALAALAGLLSVRQTGQGMYLDVSDQEVVASLIGDVLADAAATGREFVRNGNVEDGRAGAGCYPCKGMDQWIAIEQDNATEWQALCRAIGRPDLLADPSLASQEGRWAHRQQIEAAIGEWSRRLEKPDAVRLLQEAGVKATVVASGFDLFTDDDLHARGMWQPIEHKALGKMWVVDSPVTRSPRNGGGEGVAPAPLLGEHTDEVLREVLSLSEEKIKALRVEGALR